MMRLRAISNKQFRLVLLSFGLGLSLAAQAEAPVVDLTSSSASSSVPSVKVDTSDMSVAQRLSRVENIVAGQNSLDLINQINSLQQQVEALQGKVDLLQHQLMQLQSQTTQQYSDVNTRLTRLESAPKTGVPAVALPTAGDAINENKAYQQAYAFIGAQKYPEADKGLQAYIKQYPQGTYVSNAYYWLPGGGVAVGQIQAALGSFQTVVTKYPTSNKAPDALLKLANINAELGDKAKARQQYKDILSKYPKANVAKVAKTALDKLK